MTKRTERGYAQRSCAWSRRTQQPRAGISVARCSTTAPPPSIFAFGSRIIHPPIARTQPFHGRLYYNADENALGDGGWTRAVQEGRTRCSTADGAHIRDDGRARAKNSAAWLTARKQLSTLPPFIAFLPAPDAILDAARFPRDGWPSTFLTDWNALSALRCRRRRPRPFFRAFFHFFSPSSVRTPVRQSPPPPTVASRYRRVLQFFFIFFFCLFSSPSFRKTHAHARNALFRSCHYNKFIIQIYLHDFELLNCQFSV